MNPRNPVGDSPAGLVELFERRRLQAPDQPVLYADGLEWTADALGRRADACAAALAVAGVGRGDHVAFLLDNSADFVAAFFAVARLGAVAVTLNTALREDSLRYILPHCDAKVLLIEPELVRRAAEIVPDCGRLETLLVRGGSLDAAIEAQRGAAPPPVVRRDPAETAGILYTSGTTGLPKGVMLTDRGYEVASARFVDVLRLGPEDVIQTCLPLFHVNAQQLSLCGALACGAKLVLDRRFSASGFWESIGAHGVTSFNLIGAMLGILHAQEPTPREHEHAARVACVAPVPAAIHTECEERFGLVLLDGYGLTETTPGITYNPYGQARPGSCGKPAPYVDLRIAGPEGEALPPGERGEILVRALEPNIMMAGYYKDPAATAKAVDGGWFHTGDRGFLDEDGYLYFVDRIKDVIRRRGENISAVEVERAALRHPAVLEAAAVGVSSELAGGEDDVALFVVVRPGEHVDPLAIVAICEERLASFMVPRYVGILDEFPRTETQRVQKFALRERGIEGCFDREGSANRAKGETA